MEVWQVGGAGEGVAGAATSSGLRAAGDTLAQESKFIMTPWGPSAIKPDGSLVPVTSANAAELGFQGVQTQLNATSPKELGIDTLKGAAPTIVSGLLNSLGGFGTGPSKGLYVDDAGSDPLLGTIESGLGLLDPFSEV